jgi:beta-lactamase regulating signal transducer with metallopeptidase domain
MTSAEIILRFILAASIHAALIAPLVLLLQKIPRLPARWRFALWFLVLIPLTPIPLPASSLSLLNLLPAPTQTATSESIPDPVSPSVALAPVIPDPAVVFPQTLPPRADTTAPAAPTHVPQAPLANHQLPAVLFIVYLTGAAVIFLRQSLATQALRRLIKATTPATDPALLHLLDQAKSTLHLGRKKLPLLLTNQLASPALAGLLRPRLLLPIPLLESLSEDDLRNIFLHECAHLHRRDILLNHWLALLSILHWFNPILWILLPRIKADRELATDELVLQHATNPTAYGETLLKLLAHSIPAKSAAPSAIAILERNAKPFLKRRFQMIANHKNPPRWLTFPALALLLALAALILTAPISTAAETAATNPSRTTVKPDPDLTTDLAPDALLQREIKKWKGYKQSITGQSPDDKLMKEECDRIVAYLEKYIGAPYPPKTEPVPFNDFGGDPLGFPGGGAVPVGWERNPDKTIIKLQRMILNHTNTTLTLHADKQPFADVLKGFQDQVYNALFIDQWFPKMDPRPRIVQSYTQHTILVDWKTLALAGIHPNTPVTIDVKKVSDEGIITSAFTRILWQLLIKAQGEGAEALPVTTTDGIEIAIRTRVTYNVRDLLAPVASKQAGGLSVPGNADDLIKAIKTSVSPNWWKTNAKENTIIQFKGLLTITTTPEIHTQVQTLLDSYRKADKEDTDTTKADLERAASIKAHLVAILAEIQARENQGKNASHPEMIELQKSAAALQQELEDLRKKAPAK